MARIYQRRTSLRRREKENAFESSQRQLASSTPMTRAQAALGLATFAQTPPLFPGNDAPRSPKNYPLFDRAAMALSSALSLESDPTVRTAIRDAIQQLAHFASTDHNGQPLLHRLVARLATANRIVRDRFIRIFAEWSIDNADPLTKEKGLRYLVALAPLSRDSSGSRLVLDALTHFGETHDKNTDRVSAYHIWRELKTLSPDEASVPLPKLVTTAQQLQDARDALADALHFLRVPPGFSPDATRNDHSSRYVRSPMVDLRGCFLGGANLRDTQLHGANLSGAILTRTLLVQAALPGAYLDQTQLQEADLSQAWLPGVWLGRSQLQKANLAGAQLQNASLNHSCLQGAKLIGAHLSNADFGFADLRDASFNTAQMEETQMAFSDLRGAILFATQLPGATFHGALVEGAQFIGANMDGAYLEEVNMNGMDLSEVSLRKACLREAQLSGASLRNARLQEADLRLAHLEAADLTGAQLQKAGLDKARIEGADFRNADLSEATLYGAFIRETATDIDKATCLPEDTAAIVRFEPKHRFYKGVPVRDDESDARTMRLKAWLTHR